jgi:glycosyltransferase involved in cell wall biosynthesis
MRVPERLEPRGQELGLIDTDTAPGFVDVEPQPSAERLKILILADRCWSHPQGGGTGANLYAQVRRWADAGHQVTVIAGDYPGAQRLEQLGPNLAVHRMGGRATVFPRGAWAVMRGLGRDADVVLEIINGITFLTPLWLRKPRVALVCHPHRELYVGEFGRIRGRILAALLEELPLRLLYRRAPFLTISESAKDDLVKIDGIPRDHIRVSYCGVEPGMFAPAPKSAAPKLLYLGRLKAYKRIEHVLDVLEAIPGATLDIVGDGDHREALEAEVARRGLAPRVEMYGHVDDATRAQLYGRAWILLTASSSEGWGLTVIEAALCGTPSAALAVGGLRESIVDGETGVLAQDMDELTRRVAALVADRAALEALGERARRRALTFSWERTAEANLAVLRAKATAHARR